MPYGVVSNRHGRGALHGEYPVDGRTVSVFADVVPGDDGPRGRIPITEGGDRYARFPLAPFLGIMGVATPGERLHSVPPGRHGGNIDVNLLQAGAQLHLPVLVPDALAYVGDPHFAQGDGEVALTAMEASLRATVRFDVTPAAEARSSSGNWSGRSSRRRTSWCRPDSTPTSTRPSAPASGTRSRSSAPGTAWSRTWRTPTSARRRTSTSRRWSTSSPGRTPASARPTSRTSGERRTATGGPTAPAGLLDALDAYERALADDDLAALDDAFVRSPGTLRGDDRGLLVGHEAISAFRGTRGGIAPRHLSRVEVRVLAEDLALVVSVSAFRDGGSGLQTQLWRHDADAWRIEAAHVTGRPRPSTPRCGASSATRSSRPRAAARSTVRRSP